MNARQKAEKQFHDRRRHVGLVTDREIEAFVAGAYYATSPDNTEAVEAVVRVLDEADTYWLGATYEELAKAALTELNKLMKGENGE